MKIDHIDFHRQFIGLIKSSEIKIINGDIEISSSEKLIKKLIEFGLKFDDFGSKVRIFSNSMPFKFFKSHDDFESFWDFNENHDILILGLNSSISKIGNEVFENFDRVNSFYFTNKLNYKKFIKFLKEKENESENGFQFTDSMNLDLGKITLISNSGISRLRIKYESVLPKFNDEVNCGIYLEKFIQCFDESNKNFPRFLKSSLIDFGNSLPEFNRLKLIFEKLDEITKKAEINFEVYLSELSIDKFKKDYDELKTKYFKELSDTLAKITQKVVALPIGISASLIAIDRIKDNIQFLIFLMIVILSTSILLSILINSNLKDLSYLNKIFYIEYNQLQKNPFFKKFPHELSLFIEIKEKFTNRIEFYFNLSKTFFWVMNIANIYLILYIIFELEFLTVNAIYCLGFILLAIAFYLFFKMEKLTIPR